jgi:hypothetical protein
LPSGTGVMVLVRGFVIHKLRYSRKKTTLIAAVMFPPWCGLPPDRSAVDGTGSPLYPPFMCSLHSPNHEVRAPA